MPPPAESRILSRFRIYSGRFSLIFVFAQMNLFGQFSYKVDYKAHRAFKSPYKLAYCVLAGITAVFMYLAVLDHLLSNTTLVGYYDGVSYYAIIVCDLSCLSLISTFYGFQVVKRQHLIDIFNDLDVAYKTFGLFYSVEKLNFNVRDLEIPENMREINHVYRPLFWKGVVCHLTILLCLLDMSYLVALNYPNANLVMFQFYFCFPYTFQTATSSYMMLGLRKLSFLFSEMQRKLREIHEEVRDLTENREVSQFQKMKRFCELSDQVDSMALSFERITGLGMTFSDCYQVHFFLILIFNVANSLTMLFLLYMGVAHHVNGIRPIDFRITIAACLFIVLDLTEILFLVNSVEMAENMSNKVLKEVHLVNYWQKGFDCQLKRSVRKKT